MKSSNKYFVVKDKKDFSITYFEYEKVGDYYLSCIDHIYGSTLYLIKLEESYIEAYGLDYKGNGFFITKYIISENKFCYTELFIDIDNKVVDN